MTYLQLNTLLTMLAFGYTVTCTSPMSTSPMTIQTIQYICTISVAIISIRVHISIFYHFFNFIFSVIIIVLHCVYYVYYA